LFILYFYKGFGVVSAPLTPSLSLYKRAALRDLLDSFKEKYGHHYPEHINTWTNQFKEGFKDMHSIVQTKVRSYAHLIDLGESLIALANKIHVEGISQKENKNKFIGYIGEFIGWAVAVTEYWYCGKHWEVMDTFNAHEYQSIHLGLVAKARSMSNARILLEKEDRIRQMLELFILRSEISSGTSQMAYEFVNAVMGQH